ncbi:Ig-like domain-containing protein [Brevibacillus centrosporus]|uniref:Ig-like domain-containing protein n=1 Tax=Brevibacillus centrosporus TaxID=54910 RepID=UPI002E1D821C|nr:Ig-like domain-containing protein [Brevibacillus centrosporus]
MPRNIFGKKSWISAVLSILLFVTAILPFGAGIVHAAGGISLIGFSNNTTATNPHIYYSRTLSLQGTYGMDINGEDLRYSVSTLNGSQSSDTSSIKPGLDTVTRTFTFDNISLTPGVNKISFYEKNGNTTTDLVSLYVQYNNTPLISNLKLNSVFLESDPTIVEVTSTRNLTLALSGKASNADNIVAINKTTGKTFSDDVNTSGNFSIDLDTQIGLNNIDIHAYSQNKEVALINRNVLVIPKSSVQGSADQLYNAKITEDNAGTVTNIEQIPPAANELIQTDSANGFKLNANLLIKLQSGATVLDSTIGDTSAPDAPAVQPVTSSTTAVTGTAEAGSTVTVKKGTAALNTATAGNDGSFSVTITAQPSGTILAVTAKDVAGNESTIANVTVNSALDTLPPAAPVVTPVKDNHLVVTGTAEAGSTVSVKRGPTLIGTAFAASNGIFSVTIAAQPTGTTLSVTATDSAGNSSPAAAVIVAPAAAATDVTSPDAPVVNPVISTDKEITGIAEAGTTVSVSNGGPSLGTATAATDGSYSITIPPQGAGTDLTINATDSSSNVGPGTTITVTVAPIVSPPDTAAPAAPTGLPAIFDNSSTIISGTVDPADVVSTVQVKRGGTVLGVATPDAAGGFSVVIAPQRVGDVLSVTASDAAGNISPAAILKVTAKNSLKVTFDNLDSSKADIQATVTKFSPIVNNAISSEYKLYNVEATVVNSALLADSTYALVVKYETQKYDQSTLTNVVTESTVANFPYQIVFKDANGERFGAVTDISSPTAKLPIKTDGTANIVSVLPAKVAIETFNMLSVSKADYEVFFNNSLTPLNEGAGKDYLLTLTNDEAVDPSFDSDSTADPMAVIEFLKLPSNETKVKVKYQNDKEIAFTLKPEVVPSLLFYYTASGQDKVIDSQLEITDPSASKFIVDNDKFRGKIYNYKLNSGNMKVTLNGNAVTYLMSADANPTDNIVPFEINKSQFLAGGSWNFKQGSNNLTFELLDDPNVKFTYNIIYNTEKTPKIQDVKLKVVQGKSDVELEQKSSDTAYNTSALFLSEFSFNVANVEPGATVSITKDGNVIAKYSLTDPSGDWDFLSNDSEYVKARDAAIKGNTSDLGPIFDDSTFSEAQDINNKFSFKAAMDSDDYGDELVGELDDDMGLAADELENRLKLFPLTLTKGGTTSYQIEITQGSIATRQTFTIAQDTQAWTVISPTKSQNAPYIQVNSNSVPVKIFAEKATKVLFGKTEAVAYNTTDPDFTYDSDTGKLVPETYYVFQSNVSLKPGLNTIKFTVQFGSNSHNDEIKIYNMNSSVGGAESREIFGKKLSFSVFEKAFELKFPTGTVLLAPQNNRVGSEINPPSTDIFTDVPLYFGIADRTNGRVSLDDDDLKDDMEDVLRISSDFNYASPLYYVDAGNSKPGSEEGDEDRAPGGRDPYFEGTANNIEMEAFVERWEDNLVPSKVGTLTIKYDSSIVNAANNILTIFYNNGDEWVNLGGVVNTSKKTVTVPFKGFGYYMVMKTRETFSDVINHSFARDAIETLYAKGIMNDAPGSGFGTELKITRGEFATMIVKALGLPINAGPYEDNNENNPAEPTFTDVRPRDDDWNYEYKYIETAARAGIVRGKDTRSFFPDDPLTREEAAIIMARALNLKLGTPEAAALSLGKLFTDGQQTGYYAAPSVLAIAKAKIMTGSVNDATAKKPTYRFNPKGDLTRAEMAVITIRVMVQLKKLPKQ